MKKLTVIIAILLTATSCAVKIKPLKTDRKVLKITQSYDCSSAELGVMTRNITQCIVDDKYFMMFVREGLETTSKLMQIKDVNSVKDFVQVGIGVSILDELTDDPPSEYAGLSNNAVDCGA